MGNLNLLNESLNKPEINDCPMFLAFKNPDLTSEELIHHLKVTRFFKCREPWTVWTEVINSDSYSDQHRILTLFEFFKRFATQKRPIADFLADEEIAPWFQNARFVQQISGPGPAGIDFYDFHYLTPVFIEPTFMEILRASLYFTIDRLHPSEPEMEKLNEELHRIFTTREEPCDYVFDQIGYSYLLEYNKHFL